MSLTSESDTAIPEETVALARVIFTKGNPYVKMRDERGRLFEDEAFAELFSQRAGRSPRAASTGEHHAILSIMQYFEFRQTTSAR